MVEQKKGARVYMWNLFFFMLSVALGK
jgi:hypothetical protein